MRRFALLAATAAVLSACTDSNPSAPTPAVAPSLGIASAGAVPGRFIVTLREDASPSAVAAAHGVQPQYVYSRVLNGFAGSISEAARAGLLRDGRVSRIEQDGVVTAIRTFSTVTQTGAPWGLDRVDARAGLDGAYSYAATGAGVTAYIIDTGIRGSHAELSGRVSRGFDAFGGNAEDCDGHGTHVAGTVGGETYGVAKDVQLVAVRVLDCSGSGTWSGVIAGMDWVAANRQLPAVANMSLGGGASASVDDATRRMIASGVVTAVAAGNGNMGGREQDACNYSPARVPEAITIGATSQSDAKTSWSNYGSCVDWFAPGYQITSAWYTSDTATNTISGTSMAAPHVAGSAALYKARFPGASPGQVTTALLNAGNMDWIGVDDPDATQERLLNVDAL